jgi:hypothetical protein
MPPLVLHLGQLDQRDPTAGGQPVEEMGGGDFGFRISDFGSGVVKNVVGWWAGGLVA